MSAVKCIFCEKVIYQYENSRLLGITSELPHNPWEMACDALFSVEKAAYLERLEALVRELSTRAEDAVVEKLTAELVFRENGNTEIVFYIIVAFRTEQAVSSYWFRKMRYNNFNSDLMSDELLGSVIKNFSYVQQLPKLEMASIPDQCPVLMTPECVWYMEENLDILYNSETLEEEKRDEEGLVKRIENGYYVTRILAHSLRKNSLRIYCGTAFQIEKGKRSRVFWNAEACLRISSVRGKKKFYGRSSASSEKSLVNTGKYPWLLLEREEDNAEG